MCFFDATITVRISPVRSVDSSESERIADSDADRGNLLLVAIGQLDILLGTFDKRGGSRKLDDSRNTHFRIAYDSLNQLTAVIDYDRFSAGAHKQLTILRTGRCFKTGLKVYIRCVSQQAHDARRGQIAAVDLNRDILPFQRQHLFQANQCDGISMGVQGEQNRGDLDR